ncbi:unnamed protein product [Notodromas monacha]|uniref:Erythroid differentiation-related factor 1 n=1 Tax=Notodromas monacha TaxID=399045 RepID=A0A7R9G8U1_9CRUS|nr:unnamed protein product [Notodromas monacha]CAG0912453.1 unnamed protein product [Notodromas monacha]
MYPVNPGSVKDDDDNNHAINNSEEKEEEERGLAEVVMVVEGGRREETDGGEERGRRRQGVVGVGEGEESQSVVRSSAVVQSSLVPGIPQFLELGADTDLRLAPDNWLHGVVRAGQHSLPTWFLMPRPRTAGLELSSGTLAAAWAHLLDSVDVVADAEHIKTILKLPLAPDAVSLLVHRVGRTLLVDEVRGGVDYWPPSRGTNDLPRANGFSPLVVKDVARNILSFLKSNATLPGHTYWLFKGKNDDVVKLYDLTSLCRQDREEQEQQQKQQQQKKKKKRCEKQQQQHKEEQQQIEEDNNVIIQKQEEKNTIRLGNEKGKEEEEESDDGGSVENPYTVPVALLLYRVAKNLLTHETMKGRRAVSTIGSLLTNCVALLDETEHSGVVSGSHFMLANLCLEDLRCLRVLEDEEEDNDNQQQNKKEEEKEKEVVDVVRKCCRVPVRLGENAGAVSSMTMPTCISTKTLLLSSQTPPPTTQPSLTEDNDNNNAEGEDVEGECVPASLQFRLPAAPHYCGPSSTAIPLLWTPVGESESIVQVFHAPTTASSSSCGTSSNNKKGDDLSNRAELALLLWRKAATACLVAADHCLCCRSGASRAQMARYFASAALFCRREAGFLARRWQKDACLERDLDTIESLALSLTGHANFVLAVGRTEGNDDDDDEEEEGGGGGIRKNQEYLDDSSSSLSVSEVRRAVADLCALSSGTWSLPSLATTDSDSIDLLRASLAAFELAARGPQLNGKAKTRLFRRLGGAANELVVCANLGRLSRTRAHLAVGSGGGGTGRAISTSWAKVAAKQKQFLRDAVEWYKRSLMAVESEEGGLSEMKATAMKKKKQQQKTKKREEETVAMRMRSSAGRRELARRFRWDLSTTYLNLGSVMQDWNQADTELPCCTVDSDHCGITACVSETVPFVETEEKDDESLKHQRRRLCVLAERHLSAAAAVFLAIDRPVDALKDLVALTALTEQFEVEGEEECRGSLSLDRLLECRDALEKALSSLSLSSSLYSNGDESEEVKDMRTILRVLVQRLRAGLLALAKRMNKRPKEEKEEMVEAERLAVVKQCYAEALRLPLPACSAEEDDDEEKENLKETGARLVDALKSVADALSTRVGKKEGRKEGMRKQRASC